MEVQDEKEKHCCNARQYKKPQFADRDGESKGEKKERVGKCSVVEEVRPGSASDQVPGSSPTTWPLLSTALRDRDSEPTQLAGHMLHFPTRYPMMPSQTQHWAQLHSGAAPWIPRTPPTPRLGMRGPPPHNRDRSVFTQSRAWAVLAHLGSDVSVNPSWKRACESR